LIESAGTRTRGTTAQYVLSATAILGIPLFWVAAPFIGYSAVVNSWGSESGNVDHRVEGAGYFIGSFVWWAIGLLAVPALASVASSIIRGPIDNRRSGILALGLFGAFSLYALIYLLIWGG
jgi:hypothetical protein